VILATDGTEDLTGLAKWVVDVIERLGPVGVGALIALENILPPIPSEIILPFAGFAANQGDLNIVAAWVCATIGALVGAWVLYGIGALVGTERLHHLAEQRWFFLFSAGDLARGERFFEQHGGKIVLFGRCIPLVRSIVSVPAGLERMSPVRFTLLTVLGSGVWNAIFIGAGYVMGDNWDSIEGWIQPLSYLVLLLLLAGIVFLIVRRSRAKDPTEVETS
jgi:membrane protein DedA with SNARE-associated domain